MANEKCGDMEYLEVITPKNMKKRLYNKQRNNKSL